MLTVLATAWNVVLKRTVANRVILIAALVTITLATVLLAAGPIYADAVTLSGVRRTLADAPVTEANAELTFRASNANLAEVDERVGAEIQRTFGVTGGTTFRRGRSESYALPGQGEDVTDLAVFQFFDRLEEHATLLEGEWPRDGDAPYETAIPETVAELLGYRIGDELELTNRRDDSIIASIRIAGIYQVDNPSDPYWFADGLDTTGVDVGESFTTYGPFVVTPQTFIGPLTSLSAEINWRVYPDFDNLSVAEVPVLRRQIEGMVGRLNSGQDTRNRFQLDSGLVQILRETERSLLVTRSGVFILTIQLAILAGYALLLTAGLLVEQRRIETNLLRSRGADNNQILAMALMEGIVLTVPVAIAAPWIATLVLRIMNAAGPLATIDLTINPEVNRTAFLLSGIAALGCIAALSIPAYRSAHDFSNPRAQRGRQRSRGLAQRVGLDIALLVAAGVGFWQLQRFGAPLTETVQGRLGIDPLLVAAPALGLLAGGILALRTIPLLARLAERVAARNRLAVPALGAWQVARRPLRYARSALLLMLATGIGLFAVSYASTWTRSQEDQAGYQVGADIRVLPDRRVTTAIPQLTLGDAYQQVEGYVDSMPVTRDFAALSRSIGTARVVTVDADKAAGIVAFRPDLADEPFAELMQRLADERPSLAVAQIPGQPQRLALDLRYETTPLSDDFEIPPQIDERRVDFFARVVMVIQDGNGQLHDLHLGTLEQGEQRFVAELTHEAESGELFSATYPLSVVDIEVRIGTPQLVTREATLEILGISGSAERTGDNWQQIPLGFDPATWDAAVSDLPLPFENPGVAFAESQPEGGLTLRFNTGATTSDTAVPLTFSVRPHGSQLPETIPVIVTERFLDISETSIGDVIPLRGVPGDPGDGRIIGAVREFPTVDPRTGEAVVLDFRTLAAKLFTPGETPLQPDERWLQVADGMSDEVEEQLAAAPYSSNQIFNQAARETTLKSDPVALGTLGSLSLGFVAAAIFAGLGFAVSAAVSARERLTEFALLRAIGLSSRQLVGWLSIEHGILVVISLLGGTALGLLLSWVALPVISITQEARSAVPEVIVVYPWRSILLLEVGVVAMLLLSVGALAIMLRRLGLGSLLRLGEE